MDVGSEVIWTCWDGTVEGGSAVIVTAWFKYGGLVLATVVRFGSLVPALLGTSVQICLPLLKATCIGVGLGLFRLGGLFGAGVGLGGVSFATPGAVKLLKCFLLVFAWFQ